MQEVLTRMEEAGPREVITRGIYKGFTDWLVSKEGVKAARRACEDRPGDLEQYMRSSEWQGNLAVAIAALPATKGEFAIEVDRSLSTLVNEMGTNDFRLKGMIVGAVGLVTLHRGLCSIDRSRFGRMPLSMVISDPREDVFCAIDMKYGPVWLQVKSITRLNEFWAEDLDRVSSVTFGKTIVSEDDIWRMRRARENSMIDEARLIFVGVPAFDSRAMRGAVLGQPSANLVKGLKVELEKVKVI